MALSDGFRIVAIAGCLAALAGCSSMNFSERGGLRKAIGLDANAPDEFLVVSKAPLVMPPDMHLRPPRAGEAPIGQSDPRAVARQSITGENTGSVAASGGSAGEQAILSRANATPADAAVREELMRDQGVAVANQKVLDRILGNDPSDEETLDPYQEAERIQREQAQAGAQQAQVNPQQAQAGGQPTSILLEDILGGGSTTN